VIVGKKYNNNQDDDVYGAIIDGTESSQKFTRCTPYVICICGIASCPLTDRQEAKKNCINELPISTSKKATAKTDTYG